MTVYLQDPDVTLHHGDCLDVLRTLPDGCVDMVATSPPFYGLYVGENLPPALDWRDLEGEGVVGAGINSGECVGRRRIDGHAASATPLAFRDALLDMAETCHWLVAA